ncbi:MAG TPA: MYXO-CTERM sorting domain-containing protein [Polyangiales bacterium]|nr:MYXO-CTERM sorting domain-containing protein [Polyangiales bacterium]
MKRVFVYWLGLLSCCCLPGLALAQGTAGSGAVPPTNSTGQIPVQIFKLDGKAYADLQLNVPISKAQCDADVEIIWRLTMLNLLPAGSKYLQLWQGNNCNQAAQRDNESTGTDCTKIETPDDWTFNGITPTYMDDFTMTVKGICDRGDGVLNLYFLPAVNTTDNSEVQIFGAYKITIDKEPPIAPTNVEAGTGQSEIPIKWSTSGNSDVANNMLIWDTNVGEGGADGGSTDTEGCGSQVLKPGEDVDLAALAMMDGIHLKPIDGNVTSTTLAGSEIGGKRAAIGVVARDLADNPSTLSNLDCLEVVPTSGFWDEYKESGGEVEPGCGCSAPGTRSASGEGIGAFALGLLGLCVLRRARKGARS